MLLLLLALLLLEGPVERFAVVEDVDTTEAELVVVDNGLRR